MNVQEKTDIDGDAMLLISKEMYPNPGGGSASLDKSDCCNNGDDILATPVQDLDYGAFPREAQCRCHLSYSCDYRTVEVRWKSLVPRNNHNHHHNHNNNNNNNDNNNSNNCICPPPTNCCHWDCSSSHDPPATFSSSSMFSSQNPTTTTTTTTTSSSSSPSSSTAIIELRRRRYSSSSSSVSSSSSTSSPTSPPTFLPAVADGVEVDNACLRDQCQRCSSRKEDGDFLSNFCDLNWRWRRTRTHLEAQDFSVTTMSVWKWEFTSKVRRFMARFSGRRRRPQRRALNSFSGYPWARMTSFLYVIFVVVTGCLRFQSADACSSRSTPKPRPPSPTLRPNITIQTYTCPPEYAAHYCLNGATCFTVKIGESILYNCECAEGYMGQRCEFKDLDGSYLPSKQRAMLEQAGITSGVAIMVVFVIIVCFYLYVRSRRKDSRGSGQDAVDGLRPELRRPFSGIHSAAPNRQYPTETRPSTLAASATEPKVNEVSLPSPTMVANNSPNIHSTTDNSGPKPPVLVKETILPSVQSRLCV
ncbi:unnamed protein product [Allacma fusca]|uniref:EGF-like domain-containing protein n=1 Tax=Allacma fusca TaxID=39272 RepID=A0A8J2PRV0_9HEXA|nr:unnamed protein product [Allacma fusca]